MILLHALNGSAAGRRFEANKFPITVGRGADCTVVLNDAGVFDRHFEIQFSSEGYKLQASPPAVVTVNGQALKPLFSATATSSTPATLKFNSGSAP